MTYRTWSLLKIWLVYFVLFFGLSIALKVGRNAWEAQPLLASLQAIEALFLPLILASFLTSCEWRRSR